MSESRTDMQRIEDMFKHIDTNMQAMNQKMEFMMKELETTKQENVQLKKQIAEQNKKIGEMEREIRRKNIIIKGVEDQENEKIEETNDKVKAIFETMEVNINTNMDIDEIRRIGRYKTGATRPILVKFISGKKKTEILKGAKMLKGTNIWIDEDYARDIQAERRQLLPQLKEARQKGYNAKLRYNKLIVNNEIFTVEDLVQVESPAEANSDKKRTFSERSPESTNPVEREKKITKTNITKN